MGLNGRVDPVCRVLGAVELVVSVSSMGVLVWALDLELALPLAGVVAFLLLTNVAASALPEAFGASSAASGLAVLTTLGATADEAAAFAALAWAVRVVPLTVLGLLPLVRRIGRLGGPPDDR